MKKHLFPLIFLSFLTLTNTALAASDQDLVLRPRRDFFYEVHMEPLSASNSGFQNLEALVNLANTYKIKLTLLFTPQWAQMIVSDRKKLMTLFMWKGQGHEIGGHHHGANVLPWDGYSDLSLPEIEQLRVSRHLSRPVEIEVAVQEKLCGTMQDFVDLLDQCAGEKIKVLTSSTEELEWPRGVPYAAGGRRPDEAISLPRKVTFCGQDVTKVTSAAFIPKPRLDSTEPPATLEDLKKQFFSSRAGIFGVISHDVDFKVNPQMYKDIFDFLSSMDPQGTHSKTISQVISDYSLGKTISKQNIETSPFGFHTCAIIPPIPYGATDPFENAIDIGVRWERPAVYFIWTKIQPDLSEKNYNWQEYDRFVKALPESIRILGNITIGNPQRNGRYADYAVDETNFAPLNQEAYKSFIRALVDRYDGDGQNDMPGLKNPIKYWQVDDEPPHGLNNYATLLKITYDAIKEQDPGAKVLIGGVPGMPPAESYINEFENNFVPILTRLAEFDHPVFDIFDFHWYGTADGNYLGVKKVFDHIKDKLAALHLEPSDGYWITEMGTYSGDPKPFSKHGAIDYPFQSERQQAIDLVKRYVYPISLGIKKIFWAFGLKEGFKNDETFFDFTGLIYDGFYMGDPGRGTKKLGYYAYKKMTEVLENSEWDKIETIKESDSLYVYKLTKNNKSLWIAWNDSPYANTVEIPTQSAQNLRVTLAIPDVESGNDVTDDNSAFTRKMTVARDGKIILSLTDSPVYIEEL